MITVSTFYSRFITIWEEAIIIPLGSRGGNTCLSATKGNIYFAMIGPVIS